MTIDRRSFLTRVAGAGFGGALAAVVGSQAARARGVGTDSDPTDGTGATDNDSTDRRGYGRGPRRAQTDSDTTDSAGAGTRGATDNDPTDSRGAGRGVATGRSDSDSADRPGYGR